MLGCFSSIRFLFFTGREYKDGTAMTIETIVNKKGSERIAMVTCYDCTFARIRHVRNTE